MGKAKPDKDIDLVVFLCKNRLYYDRRIIFTIFFYFVFIEIITFFDQI